MGYLRGVRSDALRKHRWYRVLDRVERGIFDLTIRYVEIVKSQRLAGVLVKILAKLRDASRSVFARRVEVFGVGRVLDAVMVAVGFGSQVAGNWIQDPWYAEWFTINNMYNPIG